MDRQRAVDYLRVSTEEQARGYGIAYTGKKTAKYIASKGWSHVATFADEGFSGSLEAHERPALDKLMRQARQMPRPFDTVVVNEARGIGRTGRAFWRWVWELEDLGVFVAVVKKDYDNSTDRGRSQMRKDADYAEEERELIRDRTQGGIQEKALEGGWPGGRTPYGWTLEAKGQRGLSKAVLDEHEARTLRRAWDLIVNQGRNSRTAALQLNSEGFYARSGVPWSDKNLLNKLKSEAVTHSRVTFRKEGRAKVAQDGANLYGPSVAIALPPVFSPEELSQLAEAIGRISTVRNADGAPSYPLSGRITGLCGRRYSGFHRPGIRGYRCGGKQELHAGSGRCACSQVDADALERGVWREVCGLLGDADRLRGLAREWVGFAENSKTDHTGRLADLDLQIENQNAAIFVTMPMAAKAAASQGLRGKAAEAAVERTLKPLQDELVELHHLRLEAASWAAETRVAEGRARDLEELAEAARHRLQDMDPAEQSRVLALADIQITFTGPVPVRLAGQAPRLPDMVICGSIEPRLLTAASQHLEEPFRPESFPEVPIRFRLTLAA